MRLGGGGDDRCPGVGGAGLGFAWVGREEGESGVHVGVVKGQHEAAPGARRPERDGTLLGEGADGDVRVWNL